MLLRPTESVREVQGRNTGQGRARPARQLFGAADVESRAAHPLGWAIGGSGASPYQLFGAADIGSRATDLLGLAVGGSGASPHHFRALPN
jgi:hypothetical protein